MDKARSGCGDTVAFETPSSQWPVPVGDTPPRFLRKTYEMVDDPATDTIVSWSPNNNSFVIKNPHDFARDLLPKYFKHNDFSSFVRQLNSYGFRKIDQDGWEFANEGFLRGQNFLLKTITRRKPAYGQSSSSVSPCFEFGKFGLEEEVERLKRDKNVLLQEVVKLRQQQQTTDNNICNMVQHLHGMVHPLVRVSRLKQENEPMNNVPAAASNPRIVRYQAPRNEAAKSMFRHVMNVDPFGSHDDDSASRDSSSASGAIVDDRSSDKMNEMVLQEVPPLTSVMSMSADPIAVSQIHSPAQSSTLRKTAAAQHPDTPEVDREGSFDFSIENFMNSAAGSREYFGSDLVYNNDNVPLELDRNSPLPEVDALVGECEFLDYFLHDPVPEDLELIQRESVTNGNEAEANGKRDRLIKTRYIDELD